MSSVHKKRRAVEDVGLNPNKRLTQQHLSESEDLGSFSDANAGACPLPGPNIVISDPDHNEPPKTFPKTPFVQPNSQASEFRSSKGRDSIGPEDLMDDPANVIHGFVIPSTITYSLYYSLKSDSEFSGCAAVDQILPYNNPKAYPSIEEKARAYLEDRYTKALGARDLYFRIGKCAIVGESDYRDTHVLTSQEDWKIVCRALINLWTTTNLLTLRLEISQDYFALQTQVLSGEPFAITIRNEIHKLMKSTESKLYIPCAEFNIITSSPILRRIIVEDANLNMDSEEKEAFIERVQSNARRLLLMFINAKLGMSCLKELMDKGCSDARLPLRNGLVCHERCRADFRGMIIGQGSFMAAEFINPHEHQRFSDHVIIPIHYKEMKTHDDYPVEERNEHCRTDEKKANGPNFISPDGDNDDGDAKTKACCGSGSYSNVYRVNIDPVHHRLSKDRDSDFAVKEFKDRPLRGDADFNRELKILNELRNYPDEHIVTHLATWTKGERYYMLFPYAECNLREYMGHEAFGEPNKKNMLWLLKQFCGLAKAIKTIHNLSSTQTSKARGLEVPVQPQEKRSGWHHDLKPENILYFGSFSFGSLSSKRGTFRIADFGAGKIHTYRSGSVHTKSPNGTLTYEPPEAKAEGATSRPYDIWSLGCVFLELLTWAVFGSDAVARFAREREDIRYPGSKTDFLRDDAFWQMPVDGTISLRKSVKDRIELLQGKFLQQEWLSFIEVLDLVSRMLEVDRRKRIMALDLLDTLDRIYQQTIVDQKRSSGNSLRDSSQERASSPLPRLSLKAPDRRSPEPPLSTQASPLNTHVTSLPSRQVGTISGEFITSSPTYSPQLSRGRHGRNNSTSEL